MTAAGGDLATADALAEGVLAGSRRALSRALSWVEDEEPGVDRLLERTHRHTGAAIRLGITGPPGAGKSTLVARLTGLLRSRGERVGIVAVDPTSPFTGGALLGDRIRMPELADDPDVFMRSMATRGSLGGIAAATHEAADLLDAGGLTWVVIETVGVGQSELDVARMADVTLVVLVPESGDAVQAMKAGLMEIGDLFVVNKGDRDGADRSVLELRSMIGLRGSGAPGAAPVLKTTAVENIGILELLQAVEAWVVAARASGELAARRRQAERWRLLHLAQRRLVRSLTLPEAGGSILEELTDRVVRHELSPPAAAARLVQAAVPEMNPSS